MTVRADDALPAGGASLPTAGAMPAAEPGAEDPEAADGLGSSRRRRTSLAGRLTAALLGVLVLQAGVAAAATRLGLDAWGALLAALAVGVPLGAWLVSRLLRPLERVVRGVSDGIRSFRDRDFSVRLAYRREDELGDLVRLYNRVGEVLQKERRALRERELLLATALDRSPAAIVLVDQTGHVLYGNPEARHLLLGGGRLEGRSFAEIRAGCPPEMQELLASSADGLFAVRPPDREGAEAGLTETYHLSQRTFRLSHRRFTLVLLRRLTGELGRQEAEIWKKVIRVLSHELNNSLAPVSSLVHSAEVAVSDPRHAARAGEIFAAIRERLEHLHRFIEGYARFARLPRPHREEVPWEEFLRAFAEFPFRLQGPLPAVPGWFDRAQMQQVLVNLLKNAAEASDDGAGETGLRIESTRDGGAWIQVSDRGRGMDEETLRKALLPFYTTKAGGSGVGLPLCREILEAHRGKLSLQSSPGEGTVVTCWLPPRPRVAP